MLLSAFEASREKRFPCIYCGSLKFIPVCLREDNTLVVHCQGCDLESVNPLPTIKTMQENYKKEMLGNETSAGLHSNYILERQKRIKSFSKLFWTPNSKMQICIFYELSKRRISITSYTQRRSKYVNHYALFCKKLD